MPLPWATGSARSNRWAPPVSSAFTWSGVMVGRCWTTRAAAPDTTAAAWEVPVPLKNRSATRAVGFSTSMVEPGSRRPTMEAPGATRSGLRVPSPSAGPALDGVVLVAVGASAVGAADRQHVRVVGRVVELGGAEPFVAGRDDHHDALASGHFGGVGERVQQVVLH